MLARCPACQATYDASTTFCTRDGTRLVREAPAPPPAESRLGLVLGLLGGLVLVLVAAVAVLLFRPDPAPVVMADGSQGEVFGDPAQEYTQTQDVYGGVVGDAASQLTEVDRQPAPPVPDRDLQQVGTAPPPPPPPSRSAASYGPTRIVTSGDGLLLRAGPGRQYDVLGKMLPGDVVMTERCQDGTPGRRWCTVIYGGIRGWALDEFLDIGALSQDQESGLEQAFAASDPVGQPAYIDGSKVRTVNLRSRPYAGAEKLVEMPVGTSMTLVRCLPYGWSLGGRAITGRWCFVNARLNGRSISGWASDGALRW
jgi:uncharacterized protein YraI